MRTAILTDVHANLEALTACIAAADRDRVDRLVCLGDTVGYGANPNEACDLVRARCRQQGVTVDVRCSAEPLSADVDRFIESSLVEKFVRTTQ